VSGIAAMVDGHGVLVCCGAGGVGKTTTAAALGVAAALRGRVACVVTVDPARRLADSLGESQVKDDPVEITGPWPGQLFAVMLDAKTTFDALVERYSSDPSQAQRILDNPIYANLASVLSGTQEYMATEKLFELHEEGSYDLVVVDTPPTRHALDFLDAPHRLESFLDNRIFRALIAPTGSYLRAAHAASQLLVRSIARVTGAEIVDDTIAFFQAFQGMEKGFRDRAARVDALLSEDTTGFVLVAAPRADAIGDASWFATELSRRHQRIAALIVNRVHPDFGPPVRDSLAKSNGGRAWAALTENLTELGQVARREQASYSELAAALAPAPTVGVPLFDSDVHDVEGLLGVVRHLLD